MAGGPVGVIGAGNVGCALAADLTLRGFDVRLCNRSSERLDEIRRAGGITVTGAVEGFAYIATLTTDVGEAVRGADVVAVTVPTPGLPFYAGALAGTTSPDQVIWLDPGHSGGALYLGAELRRRSRTPLVCQLSTAPTAPGWPVRPPSALRPARGVAGGISEPPSRRVPFPGRRPVARAVREGP